jgi:Tol biopolymer transport system component
MGIKSNNLLAAYHDFFSRSGTDAAGERVAPAVFKLVVGAPRNDDTASDTGSVYVYDLDGTGQVKITASDAAYSDRFGHSVSVGNNKVVVGAYRKNSLTGAAYIYDLDGTNEVKITASDAGTDYYAEEVVIGSNKVVVGAPRDASGNGSVYVYDLDGTNEVKITASDAATASQPARFGQAVAIGDGKIIVGAPGDHNGSSNGAVYVYDLDGTNEVKITASDGQTNAYFGHSVSVDSNKIVVGSYYHNSNGSESGAVYVYDLDGTNQLKITPSDAAANDWFGHSVAVDNNKIVVSSHRSGAGSAYVYDLDGTNEVKITPSDGVSGDQFGWEVAIDNNKIIVGADYDDDNGSASGSAYVYDLDGTNEVKITPSDGAANDWFGHSVAVG